MTVTESELLNNFPKGYTPNESQRYILHELAIALDKGKKYIIINAPTATGKSFISKTLANYSKSPCKEFLDGVKDETLFNPDTVPSVKQIDSFGTAILTVTKSLQNQYLNMFPDGNVLKGKSNYECSINPNVNCEHGNCIFSSKQRGICKKQSLCPYTRAKQDTVSNKIAFYNYSMFNKLVSHVKHKQFLICDEASELENEIVKQYTITLKFSELTKIDDTIPPSPALDASLGKYYTWLESVYLTCEHEYTEFIKKLQSNKRKKKLSPAEYKRITLLLYYKETSKTILDAWNLTDYIVKHEKGSIVFQPFNVNNLAKELFIYGDTVILMSATIVDHHSFARTLGIDDYYYIEAKMTLDSAKAPIYILDKFPLNYKNKDKMLPKMCEYVDAILHHHKGQKGIIHTYSMDILYAIQKYCRSRNRMLFRSLNATNEQLLEEHRESVLDTVLVSPSMSHGVDLKGKLGEFQIIMKAPFLPLNDVRIKKLFNSNKVWYQNMMLSTLIQMCGRCNRDVDDYAITYILDANVLRSIRSNLAVIPQYFIDRLN